MSLKCQYFFTIFLLFYFFLSFFIFCNIIIPLFCFKSQYFFTKFFYKILLKTLDNSSSLWYNRIMGDYRGTDSSPKIRCLCLSIFFSFLLSSYIISIPRHARNCQYFLGQFSKKSFPKTLDKCPRSVIY